MNKETTNKVENSEKSPRNYKNYIALSVIGVITVWALTFLLYFIINDSDKRGTFGDMFGAVNALFSGLAFAGLIITLIQQKEELSLQREELSQTRDEFKDQNKTMKRQRFENTFFNLMSLHQNITDNLEYKNTSFYLKATNTPETKLKGREVFSHLFDVRLKSKLRSFSCFEDEDAKQYIDNTLGRFNHYLHFLEGILKFIDESDLLEDKERQLYVVILRNTFSDSERCIIVYYFAVQGGWHKDIAEKYGLFYGIDKDELAEKEHYDLFDSCAYEYNGRM